MVPPCLNAMALGAALWKLGAIIVGIEPHSHGLTKIAKHLDKVSPEYFFGTASAQLGRLTFKWGKSSLLKSVIVTLDSSIGLIPLATTKPRKNANNVSKQNQPESLDRNSSNSSQTTVSAEDIAAIVYTTGSTGSPKPTILLHKNISALVNLIRERWGMKDGAEVIDMVTFPIFWFIALSVSGTAVIPPMDFALKGPGHANPKALIDVIQECKVTSMFASPALLTNLSTYANNHNLKTPSIKRIVAGGAEVTGPLYKSVKSMLSTQGELYSNYGATEAMPLSEISGDEVLNETWKLTEVGKGLCAGRPYPNVELKIIEISDDPIDSLDQIRQLPEGMIGEIACIGPHFSFSYYKSETDIKSNKINDGDTIWHRIGDTGYIDNQGRLWICGRKSQRVISDNVTLYPLCCEPVFNSHSLVKISALVGPTINTRIIPTMCIVLRDEDTSSKTQVAKNSQYLSDIKEELLSFAKKFEATKYIEEFIFLETMPVDRRHNAKIDRANLTKLAATKLKK
jgi:acyl-coenzyme A synthetase/AMP-(fatty) acid ligase